jgi:hypothetical protein
VSNDNRNHFQLVRPASSVSSRPAGHFLRGNQCLDFLRYLAAVESPSYRSSDLSKEDDPEPTP